MLPSNNQKGTAHLTTGSYVHAPLTASRSLKRNLLNARDRLGETIIAIVVADVATHGPEVIAALRKQNPAS